VGGSAGLVFGSLIFSLTCKICFSTASFYYPPAVGAPEKKSAATPRAHDGGWGKRENLFPAAEEQQARAPQRRQGQRGGFGNGGYIGEVIQIGIAKVSSISAA